MEKKKTQPKVEEENSVCLKLNFLTPFFNAKDKTPEEKQKLEISERGSMQIRDLGCDFRSEEDGSKFTSIYIGGEDPLPYLINEFYVPSKTGESRPIVSFGIINFIIDGAYIKAEKVEDSKIGNVSLGYLGSLFGIFLKQCKNQELNIDFYSSYTGDIYPNGKGKESFICKLAEQIKDRHLGKNNIKITGWNGGVTINNEPDYEALNGKNYSKAFKGCGVVTKVQDESGNEIPLEFQRTIIQISPEKEIVKVQGLDIQKNNQIKVQPEFSLSLVQFQDLKLTQPNKIVKVEEFKKEVQSLPDQQAGQSFASKEKEKNNQKTDESSDKERKKDSLIKK